MINLTNVFKKPLITAGIISAVLVGGTANAGLLDDAKLYAGAGVDYATFGVNSYNQVIVSNGAGHDTVDKSFTMKSKGMGFAVPVLGIRFNENFGIEGGYSINKKLKGSVENDHHKLDFSSKISNAYVDFMGYMPVMEKLELIAGIGVGKIMSDGFTVSHENKRPASRDHKTYKLDVHNKINWRAKLGAQYNINENIAIRALAAYQKVDSEIRAVQLVQNQNHAKFIKNMKSIGLSAIYTF